MRLLSPHDNPEPDDTGPFPRHWRISRAELLDDVTAMLSVAGELDSAACEPIHEALLVLEAHRARILVLDLSAVTFMTCAGVRLIIEAQWRADLGGWRAPADLVLTLTGLDEGPTSCEARARRASPTASPGFLG